MTELEPLRDATVERLNSAVAAGDLTLDEFSERVEAVYLAGSPRDLAPLVADLRVARPADTIPLTQRTLVGTVKRSGRWRLPGYTGIRTGLGTVKLDLREAEIIGSEAELAVHTGIGTIKVWVPEEWRVEIYGSSTIGGRYVEENQLPPDTTAPTLRLRLDTGLGTVKVYRA